MYDTWHAISIAFYSNAGQVWAASVGFLVVYYVIPVVFQNRFGLVAKSLWAAVGLAAVIAMVALGIWAMVGLYFGPRPGVVGVGPY